MPLLLPDRVVREIRAQAAADIAAAQRTEICAEFNTELRRIDPRLELVWWPETNRPAPGFIPGRYHIVRHAEGAGAGLVEPVVDELGGFREPDSGMFEWLRRSDMWNDRAMADRRRAMQAMKDAEAGRRAREDADRREELRDRVNAATRATVSMNTASPWTQVAGARRPKA